MNRLRSALGSRELLLVLLIVGGAVFSVLRWMHAQPTEESLKEAPRPPIFAVDKWKKIGSTPAPSPVPGDVSFIPVNATVLCVNEATVCQSIDKASALPVNPTRHFSPDATFYVSLEVPGPGVGVNVDVKWIAPRGGPKWESFLVKDNKMFRQVWFSREPHQKWERGTYACEAWVNNVLQQRRVFEVP